MAKSERHEAVKGGTGGRPPPCPDEDGGPAAAPLGQSSDEKHATGPCWTVTVGEQVYGPYGLAQMLAFIGEGRIVVTSLVSLSGTGAVHPVSADPVLSRLFYSADLDAPAAVGRTSAGELGGTERTLKQTFTAVLGVRHFLVSAEVKWPANRFESAMLALGASYQLMETNWLLTSSKGFDTVCKTLVQNIGPRDKLLASDLSCDQMASFNLGEEAARRIHRVWSGVTAISQVLGVWSATSSHSLWGAGPA